VCRRLNIFRQGIDQRVRSYQVAEVARVALSRKVQEVKRGENTKAETLLRILGKPAPPSPSKVFTNPEIKES
jgi:hypothetical protein